MERLPHMAVAKNPGIPQLPAGLVNNNSPSVSPPSTTSSPQLRQLTSNANDKALSVSSHPHFRFPPSEPYPTGPSTYIHPNINTQDGYATMTSSPSPTTQAVAATLPPVLLQRDQNTSLLRGNFQRDIIPSSITESIHHNTGLPPESSLKEVTPTNIANISNGASVPDLLNNSSDVVSISAAQVENATDGEGSTSSALNVIPPKSGQTYVDITEYLNMPQSDAAKKLGVPTSTLSKRWKEAVRGRKWPYRMVCKLDKEIMTLLHNIPQGPGAPPLPEEVEATLGLLIRKRSEELKSVVIRI